MFAPIPTPTPVVNVARLNWCVDRREIALLEIIMIACGGVALWVVNERRPG